MDLSAARTCRGVVAGLALIPRLLSAAPDLALTMSVNPVVPTPGQPVEFTVAVSNEGSFTAGGVVVSDKLPPELSIPAGLAAYPSVGTYDPTSGTWSVGSVMPGTRATLVIPAIVAVSPQPACSVNVAEVTSAQDADMSNNRAVAAVKSDSADRCVDVSIVTTTGNVRGCEDSYELVYSVTVANQGPDAANMVYLDMSQSPAIIPKLRFTSSGCDGLRCSFPTLPAGASVTVKAKSGTLDYHEKKRPVLDFVVSSSDIDYATANNLRTDQLVIPETPDCIVGYDDTAAGASGCFIATAAYGSPLEPHVVALRHFRDQYLARTALGRSFIRFYYRHSPPLATVVARHQSLRFLVRVLLTPLVLLIEFPLVAALLGSCAAAFAIARRRRKRAAPVLAGAG